MSKEFYSLQPLAVEVHPVSTGTDIILRRDINECTLTNTVTDDDGNSVEQESTAFSCEEMQYRHRGEVTADEVAAKFDYWWDIASGKTQQEADDNEAERNDEPTLAERVSTLEDAFMNLVEVILDGESE